ncbi:MAG: hypothetical protein QXQ79_00890 [Candidatus Nanoarchaeia archaeon]
MDFKKILLCLQVTAFLVLIVPFVFALEFKQIEKNLKLPILPKYVDGIPKLAPRSIIACDLDRPSATCSMFSTSSYCFNFQLINIGTEGQQFYVYRNPYGPATIRFYKYWNCNESWAVDGLYYLWLNPNQTMPFSLQINCTGQEGDHFGADIFIDVPNHYHTDFATYQAICHYL